MPCRAAPACLVPPVLLAIALAGCASAAPPPSEAPAARELPPGGPVKLYETQAEGSPVVEARIIGRGVPGGSAHVLVARSPADLERARVTLKGPVDFARSLVVVAWIAAPSQPVTVHAVEASASTPLVVWKAEPDEVQLFFTAACQYCGGSSSTNAMVKQCVGEAAEAAAFVVPRPTRRLVLGIERRCDPTMP